MEKATRSRTTLATVTLATSTYHLSMIAEWQCDNKSDDDGNENGKSHDTDKESCTNTRNQSDDTGEEKEQRNHKKDKTHKSRDTGEENDTQNRKKSHDTIEENEKKNQKKDRKHKSHDTKEKEKKAQKVAQTPRGNGAAKWRAMVVTLREETDAAKAARLLREELAAERVDAGNATTK